MLLINNKQVYIEVSVFGDSTYDINAIKKLFNRDGVNVITYKSSILLPEQVALQIIKEICENHKDDSLLELVLIRDASYEFKNAVLQLNIHRLVVIEPKTPPLKAKKRAANAGRF